MFVAPSTVALNWLDWPAPSEIEEGAKPIVTGTRLTLALAELVGSAALVAVTRTVCLALTVVGAAYMPLLTDPAPEGETDHDTAVLGVLFTVAAN